MRYFFQQKRRLKGVFFMKGYFVAGGYMGLVDGEYMLFVDESEYREVFEELY